MSPLIVCPPFAPPPLPPPGFDVWAAQIPAWFWMTFVFMVLLSCMSVVAIVYVLRELRAQRMGLRLPAEETLKSLSALEKRMSKMNM